MLASGRRSPYYVDCRQVLLDPEGAELAGELCWDARADARQPSAASPLARTRLCARSLLPHGAGRRVTGFFIRKEAKKHGLQQWLEGPFIEEGTPVVVVDDVLTSGGSLATAIEKARQAGGVVAAAIVVIDREEGGRAAIEPLLDGAPLHALFTAHELLAGDS